LIVHLVAFLVVTSLAAPYSTPRQTGSGEISLTLGFSDVSETSKGPEVTIEPDDSLTSAEQLELDLLGTETPVSKQPAQRAAASAQSAAASTSAAPEPQRRAVSSPSSDAGRQSASSLQTSPYAALLNRRRFTPGMAVTNAAQVPTIVQRLTPESVDPQQRAMDEIVDAFIAYDVGQLRGAAGAKARQKFAELGPEAVPALVRGLNKAAGIHASCPVGVIASKLMMTLQSANDPSLRQYAIDHLGVGVPETAPHFERLAALRKNWLGASAMPATVAAVVDRLESRQDGELMELMLALSDAPSDTVIAALRSGDEYLGAAAALAILQGPHAWDAQQRGQVRAAVMHLRSTAVNPQIRSLAVDAQHALAR
jgi:hypothetical protein